MCQHSIDPIRRLDTGKTVLLQESIARFTPTDESILVSTEPDVASSFYGTNISFKSSPEEGIYGMGQRSQTQTVLNNKKLKTNLTKNPEGDPNPMINLGQLKYFIVVPFYYSTNGYGFLWNHPGDGHMTMAPNATHWYSTTQKGIDFWVSVGSVGEVINNYAEVTGRAPRLPRHAAGAKDTLHSFLFFMVILTLSWHRFLAEQMPLQNTNGAAWCC